MILLIWMIMIIMDNDIATNTIKTNNIDNNNINSNNIIQGRTCTCDLSILYDKFYQVPRIWRSGISDNNPCKHNNVFLIII